MGVPIAGARLEVDPFHRVGEEPEVIGRPAIHVETRALQEDRVHLRHERPERSGVYRFWAAAGVPASVGDPLQRIRIETSEPASWLAMAMAAAPAPTMHTSKPE